MAKLSSFSPLNCLPKFRRADQPANRTPTPPPRPTQPDRPSLSVSIPQNQLRTSRTAPSSLAPAIPSPAGYSHTSRPVIPSSSVSTHSFSEANNVRPQPGDLTPTGQHEFTDFSNVYLDSTSAPQEYIQAAREHLKNSRNTNWGNLSESYAAQAKPGTRTDIKPTDLHARAYTQLVPNPGERENGITITDKDEDSAVKGAFLQWNPSMGDWQDGPGSSAIVTYNPLTKLDVYPNVNSVDQLVLSTTNGNGGESILAHELNHALKATNGHARPDVQAEENHTAGVGTEGTDNPYSENALRAELKENQRTQYAGNFTNQTGLPYDSQVDPKSRQY